MTVSKETLKRGIGAMLMASVASTALASSHREAPGITQTPKIDGTDFYMFQSYENGREGYTTLIANYQPVQAPYGGPNYYTMDADAIYEIHIDNDGDAIEDITFRFDFDNFLRSDGAGQALNIGGETVAIPLRQSGPISADDRDAQNEVETYTLERIVGDRRSGSRGHVAKREGGGTLFRKPIDYIGTKTIPNYEEYVDAFIYDVRIPDCDRPGRVFAGQRAEAFAVNLGGIFDLVNFVPLEGEINQDRANDDLVGKLNVTSLAIEVPTECLVSEDSTIIGGWTTSSLPQAQIENPSPTYGKTSVFGGAFVQQSRLSAPLVNEVVIGLPDKDAFNASEPMDDADPEIGFATYVTNPTLPALLELLFPVSAPTNFPRGDLVAAFLTGFEGLNQPEPVTPSEMMRLNTAIPATPRDQQSPFGVVGEDLAGFPNGRRPGDDVVDIALRVVMGRLCHPVPLGAELTGDASIEDTDADFVPLGLCPDGPADAPSGDAPFTDGAPISAAELRNTFPYLNTPIPGAMN